MVTLPAPLSEMDHESIDANQVPDRYLMGKLSADERLAYEEHFLDCPACVDRLEALEGLRAGLGALSPRRTPAERPKRPAAVRWLREPRALALLAACLVVAVVPPALTIGELRRAKGELASARKSLEDARTERGALARALDEERSARAAAGAAPLAASVLTLNLTRGAGSDAPANRMVIRDPGEWAIFLLDRPEAPGAQAYQARISTAEGRPVVGPVAASAASGDTLAVGVAPGVLRPGDYVLTLEGSGAGAARELAAYRFRAVLAN